MISPIMNALAESGAMEAWASWPEGRAPQGWFRLPMTDAAVDFYHQNGFLVVEEAIAPAEVDELRRAALEICRGGRGNIPGSDPGPPGETEDQTLSRFLCIHFPHKVSELMARCLAHPALVEVLTRIVGPNVKCMQSMLFIKGAGKPGQAWHQDEIYIPTRDRSLTGGWIALDDATVENGCLWVIPGSHRRGVLYNQEWHGDPRFDCALEARRFPYTNDDAVPVEVRSGSVVFFNGYTLHRSLPNRARAGYRRSLVNHYMSAESFLPWYGNELPPGQYVSVADYRDIVMVAGEDPYAWKGVEQRAGPHVRPTGQGGCGDLKYNRQALDKWGPPSDPDDD